MVRRQRAERAHWEARACSLLTDVDVGEVRAQQLDCQRYRLKAVPHHILWVVDHTCAGLSRTERRHSHTFPRHPGNKTPPATAVSVHRKLNTRARLSVLLPENNPARSIPFFIFRSALPALYCRTPMSHSA